MSWWSFKKPGGKGNWLYDDVAKPSIWVFGSLHSPSTVVESCLFQLHFLQLFLSLACRIRSAVYTDQRAGNLNWANDVNVMWRNLLPPTKKASILECPKFSLQISGDLGVWKIHDDPCLSMYRRVTQHPRSQFVNFFLVGLVQAKFLSGKLIRWNRVPDVRVFIFCTCKLR